MPSFDLKMASTDIIQQEDLIRQQIVDAARELFQQHGFRKVAMDDVAKAIGKGRSSLYYYFKNKEEILAAVMDDLVANLIKALSQAIDNACGSEEKLHAFFETKLSVIQQSRRSFRNMDLGMDAREMSNFNEEKWSGHKRIMKEEGDLLQGILKQGIKRGDFRPLGKPELESMTFVLLTSLHGMKREMVMDNDFSQAAASVDMITSLAVAGLKP